MEATRLIQALSDPRAYPHPVDRVEVRQTHISAVFCAGPLVYKVKKPVRLDFLDFSTLNRRLAPDVYLGVVPATRADGACGSEGRAK